MAYSKNKKIVLIGDTGLLSKELNESLKKQNISFISISITRKDNVKTKEELYKMINFTDFHPLHISQRIFAMASFF